jgi:hypothetical protein
MKLTELLDDNTKIGRIITLIGKIATPAGAVAIFCQVPPLSLNSTQTALASLITMLITLVLLFHKFLNEKIPSIIPIVVLLILLFTYYIYYQNIIQKDTGLIKFYKEAKEIDTKVWEKTKAAKMEICFFGTNFYRSPKDGFSTIIEKLSQGVKIRYLSFNPYSPIMKAAANDFKQTESELRLECMVGLSNLAKLENKWNTVKATVANRGELEIKFYDELPRFRAYIIDPEVELGNSFFIPYLYKTNSPDVPCFQFENRKSGVFSLYYNNFKILWDASYPLSKLKSEHPEIDSIYNAN